jgi:hypothetical protein
MPAKGLTTSERTLRAQLAANIGWAFTQDRTARTAPARRAPFAKFEQAVDPAGVLSADERAKRAEHLRRAHEPRIVIRWNSDARSLHLPRRVLTGRRPPGRHVPGQERDVIVGTTANQWPDGRVDDGRIEQCAAQVRRTARVS